MSNGTRILIVGNGEVGKGIYEVLKDTYEVKIKDIEDIEFNPQVIHICFPYSEDFEIECDRLQRKYNPEYLIINSTVAPGTTEELGGDYVYSPINGKHPNLAESIKTFTKFIACTNPDNLSKAYQHFVRAGLSVESFERPTSLEVAKILCTTRYGWDIVFNKIVHKICEEMELDFDNVYTKWTHNYNNGYSEMGDEKFTRPVLEYMPGKIGGHCVVNNTKLMDNELTKLVKLYDSLL